MTTRGEGSVRQRRPGVWEVRVALGPDPVSGRCRQRSVTVRRDAQVAQSERERWAGRAAVLRARRRADPTITVAGLLAAWLAADQGGGPRRWPGTGRWPASCHGTGSGAGWRAGGVPEPTVSGRLRVGWAQVEQILDRNPLAGMRGPPQPGVRLNVPLDQVKALLTFAEAAAVQTGWASSAPSSAERAQLQRAEQVWLLTRLAADSGARRGEIAALQLADLDGDVLTIARGTSCEVVGPTKTGRIRRVTLGSTTVALWTRVVTAWRSRAGPGPFGPWCSPPSATIRSG